MSRDGKNYLLMLAGAVLYKILSQFASLLHQQKGPPLAVKALSRRSGGIRTHDLQHPMLARYQATLHPENFTQHSKITALLQD